MQARFLDPLPPPKIFRNPRPHSPTSMLTMDLCSATERLPSIPNTFSTSKFLFVVCFFIIYFFPCSLYFWVVWGKWRPLCYHLVAEVHRVDVICWAAPSPNPSPPPPSPPTPMGCSFRVCSGGAGSESVASHKVHSFRSRLYSPCNKWAHQILI